MGHGLEETALEPDPTYAPAFRTIWQAGAARIPAEGEALDLLEPLTRWLVERGRALRARELSEALSPLTAYERSLIAQLSSFDAVLTPAMAMTPRPVGWYDQEDGERNFAQQVQYTPFTSMLNVTGLPAIVLPGLADGDGLPMGVQLIGRPGGERDAAVARRPARASRALAAAAPAADRGDAVAAAAVSGRPRSPERRAGSPRRSGCRARGRARPTTAGRASSRRPA